MSMATNVNVSRLAATPIGAITASDAFDRVAGSYDDLFTRTAIGRAQRNQVWQRLLAMFADGERILELNCGTGEDARFLGKRGRRIVACDGSAAMVEIAAARTQVEANGADITFHQLANEDLETLTQQEHFDGVYSNFSGLNCVTDLQPVARNLGTLVKPGGKLLLCLWSRVCAGEIFWYLLHGQIRKAFRRLSGKASARIGEATFNVSYPTVRQIQRDFAPWFVLGRRSAIGLFVPPSYAEEWAKKHEAALRCLKRLDRAFAEWPVLRHLGDHVLLEFTRCTP
jgi:SAM-dependent methyltransferase